MKSVSEVDALVERAHAGQVDKIGTAYVEHVRAVAAGLVPFGDELVMAGLLHDVVEDTDWTADELRAHGLPERVVAAVEDVTNQAGVPYEEKIRRITGNRDATLVKIADNAHNSHPDRAARLPEDERARLAARYRAARDVLWAAAAPEEIELIVSRVNPSLLTELRERGQRRDRSHESR
ncbi:HD domain-containing protein [Streptomyces sp. NPDC050504]|uniref:HD domain-containing protein n=1 Tax=Streptomyces sp. NPDC050504 TaxID=3365618 RepID=UPI0037A65073